MMNFRHWLSGALLLVALSAVTVSAAQKSASAGGQKSAMTPQDEGERVFQRQCSRCHNAPEGFSPRISGTLVRHMRVRAPLSEREEKALLHFLNP